jgi:acyl carrier protein
LEDRLKQILSSTLNVPEEQIREESSVENVEAWDSLAHLNIILSLEQSFGISISPEEAIEMTSLTSMRKKLRELGLNV